MFAAAAYTMANLPWLRPEQVAANRSLERMAPLELSSWAAGAQVEGKATQKSRQICFSRNASGYAGLQEIACVPDRIRCFNGSVFPL